MNVLGVANYYVHPTSLKAFGSDRRAAFAAGGELAAELAQWYVTVFVGDTCFVHAHLPADATLESLDELNLRTQQWLRGERPPGDLPRLMNGRGSQLTASPIWGRGLGLGRPLPLQCDSLRRTLRRLGASRLVIGHTPQSCGVNSACRERVWRIDTGMSDYVASGACEALEIAADGTVTVLDDQTAQPLPASSSAEEGGQEDDRYAAEEEEARRLEQSERLLGAHDFVVVDRATGCDTRVLEVIGASRAAAERGAAPSDTAAEESDADAPSPRDALQLGAGCFGTVYVGESSVHGRVAIKVMAADAPDEATSRLAREAEVLRVVGGRPGFPALLYQGQQRVFGKESEVLAMQLLGGTVESAVRDGDAVLRVGRDVLRCLKTLHDAGYVHNDLKPANMLFGPKGSGARERQCHIIDFGMATRRGEEATPGAAARREANADEAAGDDESVGSSDAAVAAAAAGGVSYGGGTPLFASVAQHEMRPTRPADDLESLWYCLAYLAHGDLPWTWEAPEKAGAIKRRLFSDGCAIVADGCDAGLDAAGGEEDGGCSTQHCRDTVQGWQRSTPPTAADMVGAAEALTSLWDEVLACSGSEANPGGEVDYESCFRALGGDGEELLRACEPQPFPL